ncbi:MAG: hypothetical protein IIV18_05990, partial [Lachnospiraceae bacterium]|nr:hypothetical protein [Lachnospiraceae bacterium]
ICALDEDHTSTADMLAAVKPYASQKEQDMIDFLSTFLQYRNTKENLSNFSMDQLFSMLTPEQQSHYETLQIVMQTLNQS